MADFYGTAAGFKAWAEARGTAYTDDDDLIVQALVRASEYIDAAYQSVWGGYKVNGRTQVRAWPRSWVSDAEGWPVSPDSVPAEVENATYEGCVREMASPGALALDIKPGGGVIRRVKAGATEVEYQPNAVTQTVFTRIDQALAPIIGARNGYSGSTSRG